MHLNAAHYNIVLLATNGQLGFELAQYLTAVGRVYCLNRADVDFVNVDVLLARIAEFKPDIIVNAAAWTAVDEAETKPHAAYLMNVALPSALATLAEQCGAWLVHYSTDYVYSGNGTAAWQETDVTSPLSVYGRTKLDGDNAVQQHCDKYLIFRTSWLYAARGNNFMRSMLKLGMQHESLRVVSDQIGAPTPAKLIAQTTISALQQALQHGHKLSGIYHLATKGETSWYGFAQAIFSLAIQQGIALKLNLQHCYPINTLQYAAAAKRPLNSRLNTTKIEQTFNIQLPSWQSQLALTFVEWQQIQGQ
ncbi:dTDP-4-dehydrorhamnose reductase [Rheinheimera metallidurans]|uniref:dTDP-4-dehydrorhamnose reductase n=1 Tax=Rheinheimera metallidurans TaxID=2925781 RepID=UPI003003300E